MLVKDKKTNNSAIFARFRYKSQSMSRLIVRISKKAKSKLFLNLSERVVAFHQSTFAVYFNIN